MYVQKIDGDGALCQQTVWNDTGSHFTRCNRRVVMRFENWANQTEFVCLDCACAISGAIDGIVAGLWRPDPNPPDGYHDEPEPGPQTRDGIVY